MAYTIISQTTTVNTIVEYDFDGQIITVNISHFNPRNEEDIITGIENREITERKKFEDLSQGEDEYIQ